MNPVRAWESLIIITIVEHDTRKYHEFIAEYCYECKAQVTIPKVMKHYRAKPSARFTQL